MKIETVKWANIKLIETFGVVNLFGLDQMFSEKQFKYQNKQNFTPSSTLVGSLSVGAAAKWLILS